MDAFTTNLGGTGGARPGKVLVRANVLANSDLAARAVAMGIVGRLVAIASFRVDYVERHRDDDGYFVVQLVSQDLMLTSRAMREVAEAVGHGWRIRDGFPDVWEAMADTQSMRTTFLVPGLEWVLIEFVEQGA